MKPVVLYRRRSDDWEQVELKTCKKYFEVSETRLGLEQCLVIGRYSTLPFYLELQNDLERQNSRLINNSLEHHYIANFNYYSDVKDFTPKTYFNLQDVPKDENMKFVVKGRTNSRKQEWKTKMFANGYTEAANISCELMKDDMILHQGVIVRDFVPLKVLEIGMNDLPFSNEWRFFYYKKQRLCNMFYWGISEQKGTMTQEGLDFADKMASILSENATFFVIDIAEKAEGGWILIEMNDGQSSGIPEDNCEEMYSNLSKYIKEDLK